MAIHAGKPDTMAAHGPGAEQPPDTGAGDRHKLTALQGLAALSLDAMASVAYGPEAVVLVLAGAGAHGLGFTLPVTVAIAVLLAVLVASYRQVIAAFPDGGGSYAVREEAPRPAYESGGGRLADPRLRAERRGVDHRRRRRADSTASAAGHASALGEGATTVGALLLLKAFAAGCSALTGVEAVANAVPSFRAPAARRAQRTEVALGALLGVMLIGLSVLIGRFHLQPVEGVTVLAQLADASFGHNAAFYVVQFATMVLLALAAKFTEGAWLIVVALPLLVLGFEKIQRAYARIGERLEFGRIPQPPTKARSLVVVPISGLSKLTSKALTAARSLGDEVLAVTVTHPAPEDRQAAEALRRDWELWNPGVELVEVTSPTRALGRPVSGYVRELAVANPESQVTVLIPETEPAHLWQRLLQNQRGSVVAHAVRRDTDAVICRLRFRITDDVRF